MHQVTNYLIIEPRGVQNNRLTEKTEKTEEKLTEKTEPKVKTN